MSLSRQNGLKGLGDLRWARGALLALAAAALATACDSSGGTWSLVIEDHSEDGSVIELKGWSLTIRGY